MSTVAIGVGGGSGGTNLRVDVRPCPQQRPHQGHLSGSGHNHKCRAARRVGRVHVRALLEHRQRRLKGA
eukprot:513878-Prorocentrum_minimum.AAC.3